MFKTIAALFVIREYGCVIEVAYYFTVLQRAEMRYKSLLSSYQSYQSEAVAFISRTKEICAETLVAKAATCKRVEVRYENLCDCNFLPLILSFKSTTRIRACVLVNTFNMKDRLYMQKKRSL